VVVSKEMIERLRERERQGRFTVEVVDPPENGEIPTREGQYLRVQSVGGNRFTVIIDPMDTD